MKRHLMIPMFSILILSGCLVAPGPGGGVEVIPILPTVVELDVGEPYYSYNGYYYFYTNERWHYATSRSGPWMELPRTHWPRETRWRGEGHRR